MPRPRCVHQLATEGATRVLAPNDANRRCQRKEKCQALTYKPSGLASCYGYDAPMQMVEEAALGYNACVQACISNVSDTLEVCCKCFIWKLQK